MKDKLRSEYLKIERIANGDSVIFTKRLIIRNYIQKVEQELRIFEGYPEGITLNVLLGQAKDLLTNL